jgi:hypothetical protein
MVVPILTTFPAMEGGFKLHTTTFRYYQLREQ